jgi:ankyrin repeat protein
MYKNLGTCTLKSDLNKNTILHIACNLNQGQILDYAISIGVDVNESNIAGDSALIVATKARNFEFVLKLVNSGADGIQCFY